MSKFLSELKYMMTVDNSHEEDNEVFERYEAPISDRVCCNLGVMIAVVIILLQCIR